MKKLILMGALVVAAAAGVWGTDLNVAHARAGYANFQPSFEIDSGAELKKLYENAYVVCDNYDLLDNDDERMWGVNETIGKQWAYKLFIFHKPSGYTTGTCRWQIKAASCQPVKVYRWIPSQNNFDPFHPVSSNEGGTNPPVRQFEIPADWFTNGELILMVEVKTTSGVRTVWTDVFDVQW